MVSMRFEGGEEIAKALDQLSVAVQKKVMRDMLYAGGELIRKAASRNAPHRSGAPDLRDHIGMSPISWKDADASDVASIKIGPTKGFAYGLPQEIGTRHHPAHPFMRPAFDTEAAKTLSVIREEAWRVLASKGIGQRATVSGPISSLGRLL